MERFFGDWRFPHSACDNLVARNLMREASRCHRVSLFRRVPYLKVLEMSFLSAGSETAKSGETADVFRMKGMEFDPVWSS